MSTTARKEENGKPMPYLASGDARYDIGVPYFSVFSDGQTAPSSKDAFSVLANSKPSTRILIAVRAINEQANDGCCLRFPKRHPDAFSYLAVVRAANV